MYKIIRTDNEILLIVSETPSYYYGHHYDVKDDLRGVGSIDKDTEIEIVSEHIEFVDAFADYYGLTNNLSDSST